MEKRTLIYIEDEFVDIESLTTILEGKYNIYPSNENESNLLLDNIYAFLGHNKNITKQQGEFYLDKIYAENNVSGYIIDYKLAGESENKNLTGISFFEQYVIKSTRKKFNCLFFTSFKIHQKPYRIINEFISKTDCDYANGSIKLLNKMGLDDIDEEGILIKTIKKLFPILPEIKH